MNESSVDAQRPADGAPRWFGIVALVVLAGYVVLSVAAYLPRPVGEHDEVVAPMGGVLVNRGLVPHLDFWSMYTPLDYYLNAFAFKLTGTSITTTRLLQSGFYALVILAVLAHTLWGRSLRRGTGLVLAAGTVILMGEFYTWPWSNPYSLALLGLIAYCAAMRRSVPSARWLTLFAGVAIGLGAVGKLNFGGYAAVAVTATIVAHFITTPSERRESALRLLLFAGPVALALVLYALCWLGHWSTLLDQIFFFPKRHLEPNRILSWPTGTLRFGALLVVVLPVVWVAVRWKTPTTGWRLIPLVATLPLLPALLYVGTVQPSLLPNLFVIGAGILFVSQLLGARLAHEEFALLMAYALFSHYFLSRADTWHLPPLVPLAALLIPVVVAGGGRGRAIALTLAIGLGVASMNDPHHRRMASPVRRLKEAVALRAAQGVFYFGETTQTMGSGPLRPADRRLYPREDELAAARMVYRNTQDDERVYIGVEDHGRVFINPTRIYWILGRLPGVKNYMLEPGLSTEAFIQEGMIAELEQNDVRWIILRKNYDGDTDFKKRDKRGADALDRHIRARYRRVATFGDCSVWQRDDAKPPRSAK